MERKRLPKNIVKVGLAITLAASLLNTCEEKPQETRATATAQALNSIVEAVPSSVFAIVKGDE